MRSLRRGPNWREALRTGLIFGTIEALTPLVGWAIGLAIFLMVTIGVVVGRVLGALLGKRAEIAGGLVLIGIGCAIVDERMGSAEG